MRMNKLSMALAALLSTAAFVICGSAQTVKGSIGNGSVTRGAVTRATVTLNIPAGLHVNSSRPTGEFMIPTTVKAAAGSGVKVGAVTYPRGTNRKFEFSERPINVYEGPVSFTFPVTTPSTFRGRQVVVNVTVRFQACTNEVCYAPKTKELSLKARVN